MIKIACDSSADLSKELYEYNNIYILPYKITLGENIYADGQITSSDIFKYVEDNNILPKTSAINQYEYDNFFKQLTKDGSKVIYFNLSSKLSGACDCAINVAKQFKDVKVIDSLSLSTGVGMQVLLASKLVKEGKSFEEIIKIIENKKNKVQASFVIDKLNYLHKGGRCNSMQLLGANLLNIRPSIMLKDGKMVINKKYVGKLIKILPKYIEDTLNSNEPDDEFCFITYSSDTYGMVNLIKEKLKKLNIFKIIYETTAGSTVTSHCGPNTIGILFYKK